MALGGALLRFGQTGLRLIQFASAAIILGIYSYYLAVLSRHDIHIPTWEKAVEGIAGAGVLYTIFGVLFTLFLGGITVFALIAVFLDICFIGVFVAIAYYSRKGTQTCTGLVDTPYGRADAGADIQIGDKSFQPDYKRVCTLQSVALAVAIIAM